MRATASALALLALLALLPTTLAARDLFVDNLSGYTIEPRILEAPGCDGTAFADVTLQAFERGLCLFHRPSRSAEETARAIQLFDQAQVRGLPPVHQQLAALMTGLAQCSEAERHLATYRSSANQDLLARTYFCRDRRLAQAEFESIRWNHALFDYADGLAPRLTLDARLSEMGSCQAGALHPDLDAECGLITNLSDTEINAFVDEAVDGVIATYFTGVESPITAMFARKHGRAQGLLESSGASIASLKTAAGAVNSEFEALDAVYVEARDTKMGPIYDAYREAILRATAILDEFERWKGGLFITSENVNLLPKLVERSVDVQEELVRVQDLHFSEKATALAADVRRIVDGETENRNTVAALCRIYYCELAARRNQAGLVRACRQPALAQNPICVGQDGRTVSGVVSVDFAGPQSVTLENLCRGAGLDAAHTALGLEPAAAAACLGAMP